MFGPSKRCIAAAKRCPQGIRLGQIPAPLPTLYAWLSKQQKGRAQIRSNGLAVAAVSLNLLLMRIIVCFWSDCKLLQQIFSGLKSLTCKHLKYLHFKKHTYHAHFVVNAFLGILVIGCRGAYWGHCSPDHLSQQFRVDSKEHEGEY